MRNPDVLFSVACCLRKTAANLLEAHDLRAPARGLVTHKTPDYECENCESLWVYMGGTTPDLTTLDGDGDCTNPVTRTFVVELAYPVCTEEISPCTEQPGCEEADPVDGVEVPCFVPDPQIGDGKCVGTRPTVVQETAYVWRARYVLESELICAAKCCIEECAGVRCKTVELLSTEQETEGGCAIITLTLSATW